MLVNTEGFTMQRYCLGPPHVKYIPQFVMSETDLTDGWEAEIICMFRVAKAK